MQNNILKYFGYDDHLLYNMLKIVLLLFVTLTNTAHAQSSSALSVLTVVVSNLKVSPDTDLYVAIYEKEGFPKEGKFLYGKKEKIKGSTSTEVVFELPVGSYAVAVYQDMNLNGIMDKNFFGAPKEPYGFSRNFKPVMSAPDFSDCSVVLEAAPLTLSIALLQ